MKRERHERHEEIIEIMKSITDKVDNYEIEDEKFEEEVEKEARKRGIHVPSYYYNPTDLINDKTFDKIWNVIGNDDTINIGNTIRVYNRQGVFDTPITEVIKFTAMGDSVEVNIELNANKDGFYDYSDKTPLYPEKYEQQFNDNIKKNNIRKCEVKSKVKPDKSGSISIMCNAKKVIKSEKQSEIPKSIINMREELLTKLDKIENHALDFTENYEKIVKPKPK